MSKKTDVMDMTSTAKKQKKPSNIKSFFSVVVPSKKTLERELATVKFEKEIEDQKKKNAHIAAHIDREKTQGQWARFPSRACGKGFRFNQI